MKNETKRTSDLSILYIESNLSLQKEITLHLKKIFSKVHQAFNGIDGLSSYKKNKPDIILTDLDLSKKNAFEMIIDIQELDSKVSIIVLSNKNDDFKLLETLDLGIIALLQKPLNMTNLNRALQKVILLKPNKIKPKKIEPINPLPVQIKPVKAELVKPKPVKIRPLKVEPAKAMPPKIEPVTDKQTNIYLPKVTPVKIELVKTNAEQCKTIIEKALKDKTDLTCLNTYKGIVINNHAEITKFDNILFTLQVTTTQLFSIIHEKKIIICIGSQYILAKLFTADKKNNRVTLISPQLIKYKQRDNSNKRISTDKSFKVTIGYDNAQKEVTPIDVSYNFISIETTKPLNVKENTLIELNMGFEIDGPSSLVHEKKFTKVFATGTIKRIQLFPNKQTIVIEHKIQKSGQNVFKKYLQQREISIINEFKMRMKS